MGFFKNLFKKVKQEVDEQSNDTKQETMQLYDYEVPIDCFDIHIKRHNNITIEVDDVITIKFEPSAISNAIDAVAYYNNVKVGYLQHKEAKWLRILLGKNDFNCIVSKYDKENQELFIKIQLPYDINDKNLPLQIKLVGVTFENRQDTIKQSKVGDLLIIKHEPTQEYPNIVNVYNKRLNKSIGVLPDDSATKYIKKYKSNCEFNGVITSIFGGNYNPNYGVDIVMLKLVADINVGNILPK